MSRHRVGWKSAVIVGIGAILSAALTATQGPVERRGTPRDWRDCRVPDLASLRPPPSPPAAPDPPAYDPLRGFTPDVDLGIGRLYLPDGHDAEWVRRVTLPLFARTGAAPVAWLVEGWVVPAAGPPRPLELSGLLETGYEIPSFIVFEERTDGWVRLRFAAGGDGVAWTHACFFPQAAGRLAVERWQARLMSPEISPLFFRAAVRHALRRQPTAMSERLRWIPADPSTYVLRPQEVRGAWMRVRLSVPSDYCASPDDAPAAGVDGWVRWRDEHGAPWLWYYTRGC